MAMLDLPNEIYNWLVSFFQDRSHCTHYQREVSPVLNITASIVQGSAVGLAAYVVDTADLNVVTSGNELIKFADDTYIVIPATNVNSRQSELNNIHCWAEANNLKANPNKYAEIIFADGR